MGRPSGQRRSFVAALVLVLLASFGFWPSRASATPAVPAAPPAPAEAAPELGGQLFSSGSPVEVQVLPASAGFTSELWLFEPGPARRLATNRDVGLVVPIGTFPAGVELVFGIKVLNTGDTFKMGPGDRNPDGIPHATVDFLEPGRAQVGFEDLFGGGDRDYNDNIFEFRGGIIEQPPSGPTANAGPDQTVDEGAIVTLDGTASTDPDSQNLTYAWALSGHVGPPITLSSSTGARPTFQSLDDGSYTFTLTVSDGSSTDTDDVVVTVRNKVPVLSAQADPAYAGGVALVTTSFTDAGILDTHAGTLLWGDGSAPQPVPVSAQGTGWGTLVASHVYADSGRLHGHHHDHRRRRRRGIHDRRRPAGHRPRRAVGQQQFVRHGDGSHQRRRDRRRADPHQRRLPDPGWREVLHGPDRVCPHARCRWGWCDLHAGGRQDGHQALPDHLPDGRLPARRTSQRRSRLRLSQHVRLVRQRRVLARRGLDPRVGRLLRELRRQAEREPAGRDDHGRRRRRHPGLGLGRLLRPVHRRAAVHLVQHVGQRDQGRRQ